MFSGSIPTIFVGDCRFFFLSVLLITCTCIIDRTILYIFSSLTFNRFRLSLLPVSMSEDHEGWVYLFLVMEIISSVHPFH